VVELRDGVLVIDKPAGPTSFDVVRRIRRASGLRRVGHGGTLDPLATGVLPICVGEGTKLAQFLLDADKAYDVTIALGVETDTYDAAGAVTARADAGHVTEAQVRAALPAFTGPIQQVPPAYSALKRDGRPLYDYARAGQTVEIAARAVTIHELALTRWGGPGAFDLRVRCSKGTYIRSLAFDLGRALGPGAHVTALRRTRSGPFALEDAQPLEAVLEALAGDGDGRALAGALPGALPFVGLVEALAHLPRCSVDAVGERTLVEGRRLPWAALLDPSPGAGDDGQRVSVLRADGRLLAVADRRADDSVHTLRVFGVGP
jgi:tRNA pseudouridine55 synthase